MASVWKQMNFFDRGLDINGYLFIEVYIYS